MVLNTALSNKIYAKTNDLVLGTALKNGILMFTQLKFHISVGLVTVRYAMGYRLKNMNSHNTDDLLLARTLKIVMAMLK